MFYALLMQGLNCQVIYKKVLLTLEIICKECEIGRCWYYKGQRADQENRQTDMKLKCMISIQTTMLVYPKLISVCTCIRPH